MENDIFFFFFFGGRGEKKHQINTLRLTTYIDKINKEYVNVILLRIWKPVCVLKKGTKKTFRNKKFFPRKKYLFPWNSVYSVSIFNLHQFSVKEFPFIKDQFENMKLLLFRIKEKKIIELNERIKWKMEIN